MLVGGDHADRDGDQDCDDQGRRRQGQGRLDPQQDQLRDVLLEEVGLAEIALEEVADPDAELDQQRLVQAEGLADLGDLFRRAVVTGEHRRRIAGRQPQHQEHEDRHHPEDRDGGEQTLD